MVEPKERSYEEKGNDQLLSNCRSMSSKGQKREIISPGALEIHYKRERKPRLKDQIWGKRNTVTELLELYKIQEKQRNLPGIPEK